MSLINEAFKELKDIQGLDEELFSFDKKGATALDAFLDRSSEPVLNIIDPLAFDEEELQPDYTGNVICRCCVCKQLIYKKPEDVVIDEETQRVNVDEECPHCCNTGGFEVVGQVEPYMDKSEVKVTVDDDEVEVEDTEEEEEVVTESLNESRTDDEIIDDYIGLRGKFRGYTADEAKQLYDTWDDKLRRPTAPEEIEDYEELRDTYGKTVEVTGCSIFIEGNSPIDTLDKSYWEVEFNDGTSMSGVSGYNIDLYDFFNGRLNIDKPLYEDTVKTKKGWVNKGKSGTHGTFKTKKAADAQRKAMFASGYKGESLEESVDPDEVTAIVLEVYPQETRDFLYTSEDQADAHFDRLTKNNSSADEMLGYAYLWRKDDGKFYRADWDTNGDRTSDVDEAIQEYLDNINEDLDKPDITLEEDDYTLDEKTGNISVDKQIFDDFVKDSYIKIHFTNDNDGDSYTEYKMVGETEDVIVMEYLGGPYGHMDESLGTSITIEITEDDINFFDEETGDIIVDKTKFVGKEVKEGDYITIKFADESEDADTQDYKFVRETNDGFQLEWVGTKELHEDFQKATVETGESILSMESDDSGKVTVTSEPRKIEESGDGMVVPVSDEVQAEIEENNTEEEVTDETEETSEEETTTEEEAVEEEPAEEETAEEAPAEEEVEVGEFEESYFSSLGKKYLQEVYNNVDDFTTTRGAIDNNKIKLEGIIVFNSGKKVKTNFVFEGKEVTKKGKVRFLGENTQITPKKNAFTLSGTIKQGKLFVESLNYNYRAKDNSTGNSTRIYGTVKNN